MLGDRGTRSLLLHSWEKQPSFPCASAQSSISQRAAGSLGPAPQLPQLPWSSQPPNQGMQDKAEHVAKESSHHGIAEQALRC